MYLTYQEYQEMGGTLDETTFNNFEFEAETTVNWYTFNRLKKETTYPEELKKCMNHIIGLLATKANLLADSGSSSASTSGSRAIASQSNDGVSVSYNILSASELMKAQQTEVKDTIDRYLQGVMNSLGQVLLYRGVYPNE